jgi:hypothetical protein
MSATCVRPSVARYRCPTQNNMKPCVGRQRGPERRDFLFRASLDEISSSVKCRNLIVIVVASVTGSVAVSTFLWLNQLTQAVKLYNQMWRARITESEWMRRYGSLKRKRCSWRSISVTLNNPFLLSVTCALRIACRNTNKCQACTTMCTTSM